MKEVNWMRNQPVGNSDRFERNEIAFGLHQRYHSYIAGFIYSEQLDVMYLNTVPKALRDVRTAFSQKAG